MYVNCKILKQYGEISVRKCLWKIYWFKKSLFVNDRFTMILNVFRQEYLGMCLKESWSSKNKEPDLRENIIIQFQCSPLTYFWTVHYFWNYGRGGIRKTILLLHWCVCSLDKVRLAYDRCLPIGKQLHIDGEESTSQRKSDWRRLILA